MKNLIPLDSISWHDNYYSDYGKGLELAVMIIIIVIFAIALATMFVLLILKNKKSNDSTNKKVDNSSKE